MKLISEKINFKFLIPLKIVLIVVLFNSSLLADAKIERIGETLVHPWGMSLLNESEILVTERRGNLFKINLKNGKRLQINNLPKVLAESQGGLLDVLIRKESNNLDEVFFCFSIPLDSGSSTAVNKAILEGDKLLNQKTIFVSNKISFNSFHYGCRLVISENFLYISLGDRGQRNDSQNGKSHSGSVVRIGLDGSIPHNNNQNSSWLDDILTKGHRNPQGIAINPRTLDVWINEHGPKGGDEINILKPGENYGWPLVTFGDEYSGRPVGEGLTSAEGYKDPIWYWKPSIAPSGMAFYNSDMFPDLKGDLLVSSLKFQSIYHVKLQNELPIKERVILSKIIGRVRDIEIAIDGSILILTDEVKGGLYRLFK